MRRRSTAAAACALAALVAAVAIGVRLVPALMPADAPAGEAQVGAEGEGAEAAGGDQDAGDATDDSPDDGEDIEDLDPQPSPNPATLDERLDAYLDDAFGASRMPGVGVAVVSSSGVVYERTFGDVSSADAPMLVGSLSKSFTAVCVMQLVERGLVELDAPAACYLGATSPTLPASVTVRSLLNQTSGFGYYDSLAQALARDGEGATVGSFSYANANYDALGRIVEHVSGVSYATYLRVHVLDPLGMRMSSADPWHTSAPDGSTLSDHMAPGHRNWFGAYVADGFCHELGERAWGDAASGYVASSLNDMASYLRMYLDGGVSADGGLVLSPSSVSQMLRDGVPDPGGDTSYAMGWSSFAWDDGEEVFSHDGSVENYCARMVLLPERDLAIVVMGDAADELAGSSLFFELADGVVASVVEDDAAVPDGSAYLRAHARADAWLLLVVGVSVVPALAAWRRRACASRADAALAAVLAGVAGPALALSLPNAWGVSWRDLAMFVPDVATALVGCATLLLAGGVAWAGVLASSARHAGGA